MTIPTQDDRRTLVDPRVDEAWREMSREGPPASLDAAILAAARREVGARPEEVGAREVRAARRQWWPLAAVATVAALAIGVLQVTPPEELGAPAAERAVVSDVPTPAATAARENVPRFVPPSPPTQEKKVDAGNAARVPIEAPRADTRARQAPATTSAPTSAAAPTPTSPPPVVARAEPAPQGGAVGQVALVPEPFPAAPNSLAAESAKPSRSPPAAPPPAPASAAVRAAPLAKMAGSPGAAADSAAGEGRVKDRTPLPVPEWIALIRRLRDEGKAAEAAKELAAFRAAHVDHERLLPSDLRDWREK